MDSVIRVLVVEDDNDLRESVVEYLGIAGFVASGAKNAAEFYNLVISDDWDVIVVDIGLPDQSGYVVVEYLRANTNIKVIILTARDAVEDRVRGYDCGADIYLIKPADCRELAAAINSLAHRQTIRAEPQPSAAGEVWGLARSTWSLLGPDGAVVSLTGKETQFLELLAVIPGSPVSRDHLLTKLYLRHDEYTSRSLDSLVRRLRAKIMATTETPIPIKTVHAVGYCFSARLKIV